MAGKSKTTNPAKAEPKEVRVARINSKQAIIVAIISAISGILLALLGTGAFNSAQTQDSIHVKQHWLKIVRVEFDRDRHKGVRVIAEINGHAISYPTRALWAEPSPEMSSETFAIATSEEYNLRFEVLAIDDDGFVARYISQEVEVVRASQLPIEGTYRLYLVGTEGYRGGAVGGAVVYEVTDRP